MEKFRLGLVGCGSMMDAHVRGVNQLDNVAIVATCDVIKEKAEKVANSLDGEVKVYTDYKNMLDDIDGVLIALPHDLHYEAGMFFAYNKKHILMEKPLCNSERECLNLIEACEENGVTLMCAYVLRYTPGWLKFKELVDSGEFGKPFMFSLWTEQLTGTPYKEWLLDTSGKHPGGSLWGGTTRLGGGQFFSHGCHYIDLMLWVMGNPVAGTHMGTNVGTPWMIREGTSAVTIKFENGAIGYHEGTWGARGSRMKYDYQLHCEKGMLEFDPVAHEIRFYNGNFDHVPGGDTERSNYKVLWVDPCDRSTHKHTQYEIKHFVECIREGKEPMTSGRKALQSLRVIWALYKAEENNVVADLRGLGLDQI